MSVAAPPARTIAETGATLRSGEATAASLLEETLEAIAAHPHSGFVETESARAREAVSASDARRLNGSTLGALDGVTIARKDMFDRAGELRQCGSRVFRDYRAAGTATLLHRLDAAGAVDVGRLHMAELAMSPTGLNEAIGDGVNPWSPDHISGGSSSGSGMAVGARLVSAALGSDTGGSVRLPAAICGVSGLKPTHNSLPMDGVMALSPSLDTVGILALSASDCGTLYSTLRNDVSSPAVTPPPQEVPLAVPVIDDSHPLSDEVRAIFDQSVEVFRELGHPIRRVELPPLDVLARLGTVIAFSEGASSFGATLRHDPEALSPQIRRRLERGVVFPAASYVDALRMRPGFARQFATDVLGDGVLLLPTLPWAVPTRAETLLGDAATIERIFGELSYWTRGVNYLGVPALSIPAGFTSNGLPTGIQLVGHPHTELELTGLADRFQSVTDWHRRRPPID